ncbi:hypothetical protein HWI79_1933 [Cryptosporidium felis]|nr:hypothetical protein HWI79_1933 [Cryptosporidium felis]
MDKNSEVEIYRVNDVGDIEVRKTREKEASGYYVGASSELVEAMLCELKWEIRRLELEIKKFKVVLYLENDQESDGGKKEAELKVDLMKEQDLSQEFIEGVDRVLSKIREMYSEKTKTIGRAEMISKIEDLKNEKELLKKILISQMRTHSLLRSLYNCRSRTGPCGVFCGFTKGKCVELDEVVVNFEEMLLSRLGRSYAGESIYSVLNRLMKDKLCFVENGIRIDRIVNL